mgnify:FL=1
MAAAALVRKDEAVSADIAANGSRWQAYFMRGMTQALLKQYTNAVGALSTAITLSPRNPFLYIARSAVQAEMTDFISSMDNGYSRISPESDRSARMRDAARTYDYDEAISDLNKAAKLNPNLPCIYYNRGNLFALSGRFPEAFEEYSHAIALDPGLAEAYFNRGLVQIYMKDTRKGLLDISKAGELGIGEATTCSGSTRPPACRTTRTTDINHKISNEEKMTQTMQRKLNDSVVARWGALILIALMMFFATCSWTLSPRYRPFWRRSGGGRRTFTARS